MSSSDLWDAERAARYDASLGDMASPEVLNPTIDLLANLAGAGGSALEFAIGNGRVAVPRAERGVAVTGIELSAPMRSSSGARTPTSP